MRRDTDTADLENRLGYSFQNKELLQQALTHPSLSSDASTILSYERLEFLGDAVLEIIAADLVYTSNPEAREGDLTAVLISLVNGQSLSDAALQIRLYEFIRMSQSEHKKEGQMRIKTLEDAFEAVFGAIFVDGGLGSAKNVFLHIFDPKRFFIDSITQSTDNPKGALQEILQSRQESIRPEYEIEQIRGADHERVYEAVVRISGEFAGRGQGSSKKAATMDAARNALKLLQDSAE